MFLKFGPDEELEKWVIPGFVVGGLSNDQINNVIKYLINNYLIIQIN